jgi:hypothetical protein
VSHARFMYHMLGFVQVTGAKVTFGLAIAVASGICFALFSPAFNLATNDQWHRLKPGVPHLVVYTAFFYFSTMSFVWGITVNTVLLYRPLLGLPKSSLKMYINDWRGRQWALLAGLLCGLGNGFQFMGGQAAGYAAADAVQVQLSDLLASFHSCCSSSGTCLMAGTATREHLLGGADIQGILQIISPDIHSPCCYAHYVLPCSMPACKLIWY